MDFFLHKLINHKKYLFIMFCCILSISFLYGLYEYQFCSLPIKGFFETLFILKKEQNEYPLYLLQNTIFIFLNTYLSSSYLGFLGIFFLLFLKGIQISFSFIYIINQIKLTPLLILLTILELLCEIILLFITILPNVLLSLQTLLVTFYMEDNFDYKNIFNYKLNIIIIILIVFIISLFMRIYLIDMI